MKPPTTPRWHQVIDLIGHRPGLSLILYVALLICLLCVGLLRSDGAPINSDLLSLVLTGDAASAEEKAVQQLQDASERRQTWVVAHPERDAARRTARLLESRLADSPLHQLQSGNLNPASLLAFYAPYRFRLADDADLNSLDPSTSEAFTERVVRRLYGTTLPVTSLEADPFLLQAEFLSGLARTPRPFSVEERMLVGRINGAWTYLIPTTLTGSAFDLNLQQSLADWRETIAELEASSGIHIQSVGPVDFAAANRDLAIGEVQFIGGTSLTLIFGLLFFTFRHVRPFAVVAAVLVCATTGGLAACLLAFNSVHLLTLIAGSSLIGISVDYAFHLLADGYRQDARAAPAATGGLISVLPAITLGLTTSLLGFAGLFASGFDGLQQIALFSGAGLICAWLALIFCSPGLLGSWRPPAGEPASLRLAEAWSQFYRPPRRTIFLLSGLGIVAFLILPPPSTDSDIRLLTAKTKEIERLTELSATLSAHLLDSRFLLVEGNDVESLLQAEEGLRPGLQRLVESGAINHFSQISQIVPSARRQAVVFEANRALIDSPGTALDALREKIALKDQVVAELRQAIRSASQGPPLTLEQLNGTPLASLTDDLYLGRQNDRVYAITTLAGVREPEALRRLVDAQPGVILVDNVSNISSAFDLYVANARMGLVFAFVLVSGLMMWRFGFLEGATTMLVPLCAFLITVFCLQALGEVLNLFHIVALTLVLGTGMDYTIYLKGGNRKPEAMLAVLLAAITTECAFGLLGASRVGALHSFGITVAIGTLATFLLAPIVSVEEVAVEEEVETDAEAPP